MLLFGMKQHMAMFTWMHMTLFTYVNEISLQVNMDHLPYFLLPATNMGALDTIIPVCLVLIRRLLLRLLLSCTFSLSFLFLLLLRLGCPRLLGRPWTTLCFGSSTKGMATHSVHFFEILIFQIIESAIQNFKPQTSSFPKNDHRGQL